MTLEESITDEGNKLIAEFLGIEPEIEYCVGKAKGRVVCYSPKQCYFHSPHSQKVECERWLKEQAEKYPEGWVIKEGYTTVKYEWYPFFQRNWSHLMLAVEAMSKIKCVWDNATPLENDTYYPRTFGMLNLETGNPMVRINSCPLFEAPTLIEATWLAVVDFIKEYNELKKNDRL